jgi:predicted SAM-dependent methyltransferase
MTSLDTVVAQATPPLRLEIGAGNKPQPGYIHHDIRSLPDIEVICDARSFPPDQKDKYDEVRAHSILEHFNRFEIHGVLREWVTLLKIGGRLTVVVPDTREICSQYLSGQIAVDWFIYLTFGGQDYEHNRHYYGFDTDHIAGLFSTAGLEVISIKPGKTWEQRATDKYCPMITAVGRRVR